MSRVPAQQCPPTAQARRGHQGSNVTTHVCTCTERAGRTPGTPQAVVSSTRNDCCLAFCFRWPGLSTRRSASWAPCAGSVQSAPPPQAPAEGICRPHGASTGPGKPSLQASALLQAHAYTHSFIHAYMYVHTHPYRQRHLYPHVYTHVHKYTCTQTITQVSRSQQTSPSLLPGPLTTNDQGSGIPGLARATPRMSRRLHGPGIRGLTPVSTVTSHTPTEAHVSVCWDFPHGMREHRPACGGIRAQLLVPSCFSRKPHCPP